MQENKISWARVSKNICYFLAPIFITLLLLCVAGLIIIDTDIELESTTNYYNTKLFSNDYLSSIMNNFYIPIFEDASDSVQEKIKKEARSSDNYSIYDTENGIYTTSIEQKNATNNNETELAEDLVATDYYSYGYSSSYDIQENVDIYGKSGAIYYDIIHDTKNFKYLMIDKKNGVAVTNLEHTMRTDTIEEIKAIIGENKIYWNLVDGKINTSILHLSLEEIRYTRQYKQMTGANINEIYTSLIDGLPYKDDYAIAKIGYELSMRANSMAPILIPLCIAVLLALGLIILNGIGKKGKAPGIHLNGFDKLPFGIACLIAVFIMAIGFSFFATIEFNIRAIMITGITIGIIIVYLAAILLLETIVKRMKTHTLWKTTILYKIGHSIQELINNRKIATKLILSYWGFCIIALIATFSLVNSSGETSLFWYVVLVMLGIGTFWYLFKRLKEFQTIQNALKAIYEGNNNIELNSNELKGVLKQLAIYIEDIAGGLSNAIEESLKNERLKTELITNVSHDIKTPLTSIINYVDLLKKEEMPNEKAKEYLEILDTKSQRLKKLTEDLVEASKASSGNIKLNMEKINVNELIKQVSGEFEDRFKTRGIEEIMTITEEPIFIEADGRYIYRVLENLYSNASKYALENTRVYVDIIPKQTSVIIQMKNISKEKLNITTEELMQRFVRGDSSRNTEGSGLGLSIASSLTELQGGKFHIYLDGDLFKVTLGFETSR